MFHNYQKIQRQQLLLQLSKRLLFDTTRTSTTTTTTRTTTMSRYHHSDATKLSYYYNFVWINPTCTTTTSSTRKKKQQQQQLSSCNVRLFHTSIPMKHGNIKFPDGTPQVSLTFVDPKKSSNGEQSVTVKAFVGDNLLRVAHKNDIDLEGACEGACACSTCHVILEQDVFDKCEEPSEDEEDMLDMAFDLQETSRLGCQIIVSKEMDHTTITLPSATRNFYVDGHIPKPH